MMKHAAQMRPKFEATLKVLKEELTGLGIGTWSEPRGGYFISFDAMEGCAKAIVAKCKDAGVVLTNAGATFPYGKTAISVLHHHSQHLRRWNLRQIYLYYA